MKVMLHKNRGTHMKNHKVEKGCILAALLFVLLWIGGSFPVNAKETGRGRVLFISSYSYAWETIPQRIDEQSIRSGFAHVCELTGLMGLCMGDDSTAD